ncbi:Phosphatidylinositol 3-kinase regulatory subunit gamma-like [Oopsacas minuta]|uniref:Phosphatidylinositol 3-kinase regulatory subunit gamma-like n=1 Tax=Oopsacas minuta TaxID=111878 RepID=A0AAV7JK34_9METZ|nr:Phosphatidylinositol 3-kinase regulatory subunit gamma-like [Oopsacas minuta]
MSQDTNIPNGDNRSRASSGMRHKPERLEQCDWYWGNITREMVQEKMREAPDGSFLVRDAASSPGEYTLTLKKGGCNKLIRIMHSGSFYGFTEPLNYRSVPELITHFQKFSLAVYNEKLDIRLENPISKKLSSDLDTSVEKLFDALAKKELEFKTQNENFTVIHNYYSSSKNDVAKANIEISAQKQIIEMMHNQIQALNGYRTEITDVRELKELEDNYQLLSRRTTIQEQALTHIQKQLRDFILQVNDFEKQINQLKPQLIAIQRDRLYYNQLLLDRGIQGADIMLDLHKRSGLVTPAVESRSNDSDVNHYENEESVYMAVAEEDEDDAIYATFTALNYERREDEERRRRQAPPPPANPGTLSKTSPSYSQTRFQDKEPYDLPPSYPTATPRDSIVRPPKHNPLEEPQKWLVSFDRDEARKKLFESREGTFLIRKAGNPKQDHDDPMAEHQYTLDILHHKDVKHVKINYHKGIEKYGFAAPYEFPNLVDLVKFYSKKSLKQHNPGLDTVLTYPLYHQQ